MLDRESACNRVFSGPSLCSVRRRWSWASVRARSFVFKLAAAPRIDNVVTAALLPHQPDQLRCRHDRHDNGERATPLAVPGNATEPSRNSSMISRARVRACAQGEARSGAGPGLELGPLVFSVLLRYSAAVEKLRTFRDVLV